MNSFLSVILVGIIGSLASAQVTATGNLTMSGKVSILSSTGIPSSFFGLQTLRVTSGTPVTISFGSTRLWDQNTADWADIETSNGVFVYTQADSLLAQWKSTNGITDGVIYTVGVVPTWASSVPGDVNCDFGALGGCDLPSDLAADGTGTDATFIAFIQAVATHFNDPTYLLTHAHVKYWEPWNEWHRNPTVNPGFSSGCASGCSLNATYAQMVRMTEDMRCAITGNGNGQPCALPPIDPNAIILTPSTTNKNANGIAVMENFLRCNDAPMAGSTCTTGTRGLSAIDIINFHVYIDVNPSNAENMATFANNVKAVIAAGDIASKALWDDEGGWGLNTNLTDVENQAAFIPKYYILGWSSGFTRVVWYEWDNSAWGTLCDPPQHSCTPNARSVAYQQVYNWMVGRWMTGPCAVVGTIETCPMAGPNGFIGAMMWDTVAPCTAVTSTSESGNTATYNTSSAVGASATTWKATTTLITPAGYNVASSVIQSVGSNLFTLTLGSSGLGAGGTGEACFSHNVSVSSTFLSYIDITGATTAISGNQVPLSYKPIFLQNQ